MYSIFFLFVILIVISAIIPIYGNNFNNTEHSKDGIWKVNPEQMKKGLWLINPMKLNKTAQSKVDDEDDTIPIIDIIPAISKQKATIIFLHGVKINENQTGRNWSNIIDSIRKPYVKIICPTIKSMPESCAVQKKFKNWYYLHPFDYNTTGIDAPTKYIHSLIDEEIKNGISSEKIIIGGSSKGGSLAIHAALTFPKKLGGVIAMSSVYVPEIMQRSINETEFKPNKEISILQINPMPITSNFHNFTRLELLKISPNVISRFYNVTTKFLPDEGIDDFKTFFEKQIGRN